MKRSSLVAGVVLFVGLFATVGGLTRHKMQEVKVAAAGGAAYEPAEAVDIVEARELLWNPTAELVGTVVAKRSVAVRNELAGVVTHVGFDSGSVVEQGQVLIRQDDTTERADLEAARARIRVAEANAAQSDSESRLAELELERMSGLTGRAVAAVEMDRARSKLDTARAAQSRWLAEVEQARAHAAQVEARLAKLTIRAPFRARAGMRAVHEGQYLAEGVDVVALQEVTDEIYLDFAIPQEYAPRVKPGTAVMATGELLGPDPVRIEVVAADATVNNDTRNLRVRAVVNNRDGRLSPGMFIRIRVPVEAPKPYVVVPGTAVRRAPYADSVFVTEADGAADKLRARQRFVKLGQAVGEDVIVLEGLKPGERLASTGSFKLRDGGIVVQAAPTPAAPTPAAAAGPRAGDR